MPRIKNDEKIYLSSSVRYRTIADEGVLVHLENGRAMVVNEVGIFIVEALGRQAMTVHSLSEAVAGAFVVDERQARDDILEFLGQLRGEQVLDIVIDPAMD